VPDNDDDLIRRFDALAAIRASNTGSDALQRVIDLPAATRNAKVDGSPILNAWADGPRGVDDSPVAARPAPRTLEEAKDIDDAANASEALAIENERES
jgi:hypothetical protein